MQLLILPPFLFSSCNAWIDKLTAERTKANTFLAISSNIVSFTGALTGGAAPPPANGLICRKSTFLVFNFSLTKSQNMTNASESDIFHQSFTNLNRNPNLPLKLPHNAMSKY